MTKPRDFDPMVDEVILKPVHLPRGYAIENLMSPQGRHLLILPVADTSLCMLKWKEGGDLPVNLDGNTYTSPVYAKAAAQGYLNRMWDFYDESVEKATKKHAKATRIGISKAKKNREQETTTDSVQAVSE